MCVVAYGRVLPCRRETTYSVYYYYIAFSANQSVLVYATMYGSIIGWDLRASGNAWKIENKLRQGKSAERVGKMERQMAARRDAFSQA